MGAICLFDTTGTTASDNYIADTNGENDINTPEKGNAILLDWNGKADPNHLTITSNVISSSNAVIAKSGVYSTSKTNQHNEISSNIITGYNDGVNWYALLTCGE